MVGAGLLLLLVSLLAPGGLKCGVHPISLKSPEDALLLGFFSQVLGGRQSVPGGQPWQVSLKLGHFHFCGDSMVQEDVVITTVHCVVDLEQEDPRLQGTRTELDVSRPKMAQGFCESQGERKLLKSPVVTVGECHLPRADRQEQSIPVSVITRPMFNWLHYVDCDVALLHLQHPAQCMEFGQGDSGGPLVRPAGTWTLPGVVSWMAHAKGEDDKAYQVDLVTPVFSFCLCTWNITVPEEKIILPHFTKLDVEYCVGCDRDCVSLYLNRRELIAPLLTESHQATVTFVDGSDAGCGFELTFTAIHKDSETGSGCGSIAMLVQEGKIDTANPGLYPGNTKCHWLIEGPAEYVVKRVFEDFAVELSLGCIYGSVTVYGLYVNQKTEESEGLVLFTPNELANLCGFSVPKPVLISGNTTLVHFESDGENSFRGFRAWLTFVHSWLFKRVSGAEEACPCCWPWHAALKLLGDSQCNGAVISPMWLLTAIHCVQLSNKPLHWTVTVGHHDRALRESTEQMRQVKTIVVHPHFDMLSYDSDFALMQLVVPLECQAAARPVYLPHSRETLSSCSRCTVSGWGIIEEDLTSNLFLKQMGTELGGCSRHECLYLRMKSERNYYFSYPGGITARMLCAGFVPVGGQDSCQESSGGPLVCNKENGLFALYSIVSWVVGCASPKKPGVYSRVRFFLDWIRLWMKECALEVELEEPWGFISAPSSSGYVRSTECSWILRLSMKGMAKIIVKHLSITSSLNCQEEFLGIYKESQRGRRVLGQKPGNALKNPKEVSSEFSRCMDVILTDWEGMIQSPGYPMRYANTTSSHWRIVAPLKSIIRSEVLDFWTERNLSNCHGQLMVYEGFGLTKELIGSFCGDTSLYPIKSQGSVVTVTFSSRAEAAMKGFLLAYSTQETPSECPGFDLIPVGVTETTSPNCSGIYPDTLNCTWTTYSTSGNKLKAVLKDLVTEDARDCIWDHLGVYDGPHLSSRLLGRLNYMIICCLPFLTPFIDRRSNFLMMHFKTDESVGYRCFKILLEELYQQPTQGEVEGSSQYSKMYLFSFFLAQYSDRTVLGKKYLLPNVKDDNPMLVKAVHAHWFGGFPFRNDLALLELHKPIEPVSTKKMPQSFQKLLNYMH
ncbi:LOW QUALITY PROTEIN: ovochymase-1 [Cariama cristata]